MAVTWKKLAYDADVAGLTSNNPESVGTALAVGTGTDAARDDHVHDLGADCIDSGLLIADDILDSEHYAAGSIDTEHIAADQITAALIADDAVGSEHIEALSADLDFAGNEATDMCLYNSAGDPATPVLGKIYFKTGTLDCWVCTVIA